MATAEPRRWDDLSDREKVEHYEWKYGPRRGQGHEPVLDERGYGYCIAVSPQGVTCGRRMNWVGHESWRRRGEGPGFWRHGPRPYGRSGAA